MVKSKFDYSVFIIEFQEIALENIKGVKLVLQQKF